MEKVCAGSEGSQWNVVLEKGRRKTKRKRGWKKEEEEEEKQEEDK